MKTWHNIHIWNLRGTSGFGSIAIGAMAMFVLSMAGAAIAQNLGAANNAAFIDGQKRPVVQVAVPRATPRSIGRDELFAIENRVVAPALPLGQLLLEDAQESFGPIRTGVVQQFAPVSSAERGLWTQLDDGGWLWTISFKATGAQAMRLYIDPFNPPGGAELIVYAPGIASAVRGPFTALSGSEGVFWTPTIYASEIRLEYYLPPRVDRQDPAAHIVIAKLLNEYRSVLGGGPNDILECHLDLTCFPDWQFEANGVGALSFVGNEFGFFCSGGMLNRIPGDFTPLFATAFHCGVNAGNASSLLVTWFYQTDVCDGAEPDLNALPQTQGVTLLVNNNPNDYTLVGMSSDNIGGVTFLGWDSGSWSNGSDSIGIHHAAGSWKRITFGTKDGTFGSCVGGAGDGWAIFNDQGNGELEPGSSGSPIFDTDHRVRGTASCASWSCDQDDSATYGRFDQAFSALSPYLQATDPIFLNASFGGTELGTSGNPFNTVIEGSFAVHSGSDIFVNGGVYDPNGLRINKPMTLHAQNGLVTIGQ